MVLDPKPRRALRLYLIRHGETAWSLSGQHTGRTDLPLTNRGEAEVRALRPFLSAIPFTIVLTSPLQRAQQTSDLTGMGAASEVEPDLAEWDYGAYEGRTSADIHQERPEWSVFRDGCPGGEMPAQIGARADRLIARVASLDGNVAIFSHGHFGCVLAARWIGLPVIEGQHFLLNTASVSILGHHPSHPNVRVIWLWNATSPNPADCD